jgi:hypothetical protein
MVRTTQRLVRGRGVIALLMVALLTLSTTASIASAQESPIRRNDFTSPKYDTEITWSRDWIVDRDQSAIEQSRDILFLTAVDYDAVVFIELRSQRSFRTAEQALDAFMTRLDVNENFNIGDDDRTTDYPPNLTYEQGAKGQELATYIQAQVTSTAMMVSAIVSDPADADAQEAADELARSTIMVDGVPLFDFTPLCGAPTSSAGGGGSKTATFGDSATPEADSTDCIEVDFSTSATPVPTPTPAGGGKGANLNDETYQAPSFDVSFTYNPDDWEVSDDLSADDNNGRDSVQLDNTSLGAFIVVESYEGHGGKASTCIDLSLREWGILPGQNEVLTDADGNELVGSTRGRVWGAYAFTFTDTSSDDGEDLDLNAYVECRAMPGGKGVVVINLISQPADFLDAYDDLQPILASIRIG